MESRYTFWLSAVSAVLIVLGTIVLAGCRGVVAGSGPPPPPGNVTMSVTVTGTGTGTVTSTPAGINCPTTCSATFPQNSQVTLTETPGTSGAFSGWSGACTGNAACSVTLSVADSVTATFAATLQAINHIVVFAQENRSFDHYFGAMREYWAQTGIPDQSFDGLPQFNPASGIAPLQGPTPAITGCNPADPFIPPSGSTPAQNTSCIPDTTT